MIIRILFFFFFAKFKSIYGVLKRAITLSRILMKRKDGTTVHEIRVSGEDEERRGSEVINIVWCRKRARGKR